MDAKEGYPYKKIDSVTNNKRYTLEQGLATFSVACQSNVSKSFSMPT